MDALFPGLFRACVVLIECGLVLVAVLWAVPMVFKAMEFCKPKHAKRSRIRRLSKIVGEDGKQLVVEEDRGVAG